MALKCATELVKVGRDLAGTGALLFLLNRVIGDMDEIKDAFDGGLERVQVQLVLVGSAASKLEPFRTEIRRLDGDDACGRIITRGRQLGGLKELAPRIVDMGDVADVLVQDLSEEVRGIGRRQSRGSLDAIHSHQSPRLDCFHCSFHVVRPRYQSVRIVEGIWKVFGLGLQVKIKLVFSFQGVSQCSFL